MTGLRRAQPTVLAWLLAAAACSTSGRVVGNAPETEPEELPHGARRTNADRAADIRRHENETEAGGPTVEEVRHDEPRIGVAATHEFHKAGCSRLANVTPAEQVQFTSKWEAVDARYSPCKECGANK